MKISIITVCFNSAATIKKTFDSVRAQTFQNVEYLVIDGASRDNTVEIIKQNTDIIDYWISEKDKGLYDAINKGIAKATGDYVGILNSDDTFFSPNTLAEVAGFIEGHAFPPAIIGDIVQQNSKRIVRKYSAARWKPEDLKNGFMPPHPAVFLARQVYTEYGIYRLGYKIGADYELLIRLFLKHDIPFLYSGITTTSMLVGGASTSGLKSYSIITKEIGRAFRENGIQYSPVHVNTRIFRKLAGFIFKK